MNEKWMKGERSTWIDKFQRPTVQYVHVVQHTVCSMWVQAMDLAHGDAGRKDKAPLRGWFMYRRGLEKRNTRSHSYLITLKIGEKKGNMFAFFFADNLTFCVIFGTIAHIDI